MSGTITATESKKAAAGVPATMRAAVYRGVDDVRVETVPVPVDLDGRIGPGEVLMRVDTCGICGTDLKKIHTGSHSAPRIFGHEMAGTIAFVGEAVTGFAAGDRVMARKFHVKHTPIPADAQGRSRSSSS